ncbi:Uncharacterized conserved protein, DUF302 family [Nonlabens sp. Hel1_33_55]|uniref:DUF302 domain-containing protein n=1 Tax=Nonlabens sp. Hel1_33_55 TaxID=1336802 RepID=UPI000875E26C|nr:DUF302 domain-containing protein [Nonlabens sp. Hel1_33_55]SCX96791.1 Uncharacterized conserved protein, DUF302 family [Nonlabens sp. Hel1_33_55]
MIRLFILSCLLITSCSDDDAADNLPVTTGANYSFSRAEFDETYSLLVSSLRDAGPVSIVAQVDHRSNASRVNQELRNTSTVFFGNPALGTPFMQQNQQAGLDLPQKFAVYENENELTTVIYNSVDYLNARHGVDPESGDMVAQALSNFASSATDNSVRSNGTRVSLNQGVRTVVSDQDFETTYSTLISTLQSNSNISIVAELDHQANAASVNMTLRPTRVVIFGNPALGTPLLQEGSSIALDLPQKMLVYESADGSVNIAYNDAVYIAQRHGISGQSENLETINMALSNLANTAAGR